MDQIVYWLPVLWAAIIAFAVVMYVILDGFDLGIGILFPFAGSEKRRDQMMSSIAPFWDGNETWLVLGGGGLLAAFPVAYAIVLPALYIPVMVMLLALIFRGVAFEFRAQSRNKAKWSLAFTGGSTLAAFSQGVILGGLIQGITVVDNQFAGGPFDWLAPFPLLCGLGLVCGYALLGACFLLMKTEGELPKRARWQAQWLLAGVLAFIAAVSLWTPLEFPRIAERWFTVQSLLLLWPVPLLTAALAFLTWRWLAKGADYLPFAGVVGLFLLSFVGLAISLFPNVVPPDLTIWDTAAAPESQLITIFGALLLLPVILGYTAFSYWMFAGRVAEGDSYHH